MILKRLCKLLDKNNKKYIIIILNEVTEQKLLNYTKCDCFIQLVCPRLSIDWPDQFSKPMLTPYEVYLSFGETEIKEKIYEMNNYANQTGEWGHFFKEKEKIN